MPLWRVGAALLLAVLALNPFVAAAAREPGLRIDEVRVDAGPAGSGGAVIRTVDPNGATLTGYCYGLWAEAAGGSRGSVVADPRCDTTRDPDGTPGQGDGLADGVVGFSDLPAGRYLVGLTLAATRTGHPAYEPIADQVVTVTAGTVSSLTITQYRVATLVIRKVDPAGAPLVGACFSIVLGGARAFGCDGPSISNPGDQRPDGILVLTPSSEGGGVEPGTYTLHENRPPDGYATGPDQSIEIEADRATRLTITNRPGPAGSGGAVIRTVDPNGATLTGYCYGLWAEAAGGSRGSVVADPRCDTTRDPDGTPGQGDGLADGVVGFSDLPAGRYLVGLTLAATRTGHPAYEPIADQVVTVTAGTVSSLTITQYRVATLVIRKVDPAGAPLVGACFSIVLGGARAFGCDGPSISNPGDQRPDGILVLTPSSEGGGVEPGTYTLHENRPPDGYAAGPDQSIEIEADRATRLTITNRPGPAGSGGAVIRTVDPNGATLTGYCYGLWAEAAGGSRGSVVADPRCDTTRDPDGTPGQGDGLADGVVGFSDLPAGRYLVGLTLAATRTGHPAYEPIADQVVTVTAGTVSSLTITQYRVATLVIRKVDPAGAPLVGACFSIVLGGARAFGCDGPSISNPGDQRPDGILVLTPSSEGGGVEPGTYTLHENRPPDGYATGPDQSIEIEADRATRLTITNRPGPAGSGGAVIRTVDPNGATLTGYCYGLWAEAAGGSRGSVVADPRCDTTRDPDGTPGQGDGLADGVVGFSDLPAGRYLVGLTLAATRTGHPAYEPIADQVVTVTAGTVSSLTITQYRVATLVIRKVDPAGAPLVGACFSIVLGGARAFGCDGPSISNPGDQRPDGILVLTPSSEGGGVEPGTYTLHENRPPDGYAAGPDQSIEIEADRATRLTITNRPGPAGSGGALIIGLALEIESTITIEKLSGLPVSNGVTTATGRIPLEGEVGSGSWHGTGELSSATDVPGGDGCGSIGVTGKGTYDWVIRSVTASPDVAAADLVANMDSGPIVEAPDTFTMGACPEPFTGTLNTWENLFFDTYRGRYGAMGFRVDGWSLVDGAAAWSSGGVIAEAHWAGSCGTTIVLGCADETTFRLLAVVLGIGPAASGEPTPGGGTGASPSPGSAGAGTPNASAGTVPTAPGAVACGDILGCLTSQPALLIAGGLLAAAVGAAVFLRLRAAQRTTPVLPLKVTPPSLDGTAAPDTPMAGLSLDDSGALDFDKVRPDPTVMDKLPPELPPNRR